MHDAVLRGHEHEGVPPHLGQQALLDLITDVLVEAVEVQEDRGQGVGLGQLLEECLRAVPGLQGLDGCLGQAELDLGVLQIRCCHCSCLRPLQGSAEPPQVEPGLIQHQARWLRA